MLFSLLRIAQGVVENNLGATPSALLCGFACVNKHFNARRYLSSVERMLNLN